ncbi:MAG: AIR synthase-related protein [Planctomycetota bacterium]|nr:AIR synthase-related protein [Planctomycetota bacterium]
MGSDRLVLTKPLGIGPFSVAYRKGVAPADVTARAVAQMALLNKAAAEAMRALGIPEAVHGATDITGFGLLGHARNIADASNVTLVFRAGALPVLEGAREFAAQKMSTGAYTANLDLLAGLVALPSAFDETLHRIIFDAETSGGLLISVAPEKGDDLLRDLKARGVGAAVEVGFVEPRSGVMLKVV